MTPPNRITEQELVAKIQMALHLMRGKHRPKPEDHLFIANQIARQLRLSCDIYPRRAPKH